MKNAAIRPYADVMIALIGCDPGKFDAIDRPKSLRRAAYLIKTYDPETQKTLIALVGHVMRISAPVFRQIMAEE